MMNRRFVQTASACLTLLAPVVASAATITVAPLTNPAPVMGLPMLALLTLILTAVGALVLRRKSPAAISALLVIAAFTVWVGNSVASGGGTLFIEGGDCNKRTVKIYPSANGPEFLQNNCSNPMEIVGSDPDCDNDNTVTFQRGITGPDCTVGLILGGGDSCVLPICDI